MPKIFEYRCDSCGFYLGTGWGEDMYVQDWNGKRIICPHPAEMKKVYEVLGADASQELIEARTGILTDCVCLDCLWKFNLDLGRDERKCPRCGSKRVETVLDMVGKKCPKCKTGTIVEIDTGAIS